MQTGPGGFRNVLALLALGFSPACYHLYFFPIYLKAASFSPLCLQKVKQLNQEKAGEEQCAWKKRVKMQTHAQEQRKSRGSGSKCCSTGLIHFCYWPPWTKLFANLLFTKCWAQHTKTICGCGLFAAHCETLLNTTPPKTGKSLSGE